MHAWHNANLMLDLLLIMIVCKKRLF